MCPSTAPAPPHPALAGDLAEDDFLSVFRNHPAGVAVVTAEGPTGPVALTATSVTSLSASPPLLLFSLSALSSTAPLLIAAETVVVHLLDAGQLELARRCAGRGAERFATEWTRLDTGEPLFCGVETWLRGAITHRLELGGSTVVVVRALEASAPQRHGSTAPLVYHDRSWHALGEGSRLGPR